ncbi:MAG TPA: PPOX class F420-dependent oxidoreductase [Trebonia sp.]|nr:PPOX class F420-dependent oxidoreductase [Trebonia sp.]
MTTSIPDSHRDLLDEQVAVLGTIGSSGRPQLTATWFLAEGDSVKFSLNTARQKVKNLQANPKVSVIITGTPPSRYIEIRGDAEITPDDDYVFADKVGAKYGADLRNMDKPGEHRVVVTIRPARVITWGGPKGE